VLIDWFTVAAQAINFLVLVALLKHFLYGPILRAMDRREENIAERFAEAERAVKEAEDRENEYRQLRRELEEARSERLREVEEEAEERRRELEKSARQDAADLRDAWLDAMRRKRGDFFRELQKRVGGEVLKIARKSLLDLTDESLERRLVKHFAALFAELEEKEQKQVLAAARDNKLTLRGSFEWPEDLRHEFTDRLREIFDQDVEVNFTTDPEMPLGIELTVGGIKLPWGIDSYFAEMKNAVAELYDSGIEEVESEKAHEPLAGKSLSEREET
jgi:F-type H+-transporting ATPase subunit b